MQKRLVLNLASIVLIVMLAVSTLPVKQAYAAATTSVTFTASGSWTAPVGVTSVTVELWGGGGHGGSIASSTGGGGGGGGGAYAIKTGIAVTPGNSYTVSVGTGSSSAGSPGGTTYFDSALTNYAIGGSSVADNSPAGVFGGTGSLGDTTYTGGNGANGLAGSYGGAGGSSAGSAANGCNSTIQTACTPVPTGGGSGGNGRSGSTGTGSNGTAPGGGGGGAYRTTSGSSNGGNGANGQVVVTFATPNYITPVTPTVTAGTGADAGKLTVNANYLYDANINATFTIDYRPTGTSLWFNAVTNAAATGASPYTYTISGLYSVSSTGYDVRVTYSDPDGIQGGTNPWTVTQSTNAWSTNTDYSWVVPQGVSKVTVTAFGGGGAGGSMSIAGGGGGGGGGGYSSFTDYPVTPGHTYTVRIGAAGAPGTTPVNGGDTYFKDGGTNIVLAYGGASVIQDISTAGAGAAVGVGTVTWSGGNGAAGVAGSSGYGGGGGSSAGTGANGVSATNRSGATAPTGGGDGGNGRQYSSGNGTGSSGNTPGGAGGGALRTSSGSVQSGGSGAAGRLTLTFKPDQTTPVTISGPSDLVYTGWTAPGTYNWVAPAGVTAVTFEAWAGGGAGASLTASGAGGGGGGGGYSKGIDVTVIPGHTYTVKVGAGGTPGTTPVNGGDSYFYDVTAATYLVQAFGGSSVATGTATGGLGGAIGIGTAPYTYSGGNGADGVAGSNGGGGGSSAGTAANGNNASGATGGTAPVGGGAGANGPTSSGNGTAGSAPGGGGSGALKGSSTNRTGGAGAAGKVTITYVQAATTIVGRGTYTSAGGNDGSYSYSASGSGCSIDASTGVVTVLDATLPCVLTATRSGGTTYNPRTSDPLTVTLHKADQAASFTSTPPVGAKVAGTTYTPTATTTSPLTVAISLDGTSTGCSLAAGIVSFVSPGTCVIDADQAGNNNFNAATQVQQIFTVSKGDQTITISTTAPTEVLVGDAPYTPAATASSGLTVAITIDPSSSGICSISGGNVSYDSPGNCQIDFDQAGDPNYYAAPQKTQSITVKGSPQTLVFTSTAPSAAAVAGATYTPTADSYIGAPPADPPVSTGLTVALTIDASASSICSIDGFGVVSFQTVGTCVIDANQPGNTAYTTATQVQQSFIVGKGEQAITFDSTEPVGAKAGGATYQILAHSSSGLTVAFSVDAGSSTVCSINGSNVVSFQAVGTCKIYADQGGNTNYNPAPQVFQSFAVGIGDQTISFTSTAPSAAKVGGTTYTPVATATSGLTVTFTIDGVSSLVCSIDGLTNAVSFQAVGECVIDAHQAGDPNYNPASQVQQSFLVDKGDQVITFSAAPAAKVDGPTYTPSAIGGGSLNPVDITQDGSSTGCALISGIVYFQTVGTCVLDANQAGDANYNAGYAQQSFAVGKGDLLITFDTLAPTAAVVGGPTYTPSATGDGRSLNPVVLSIDAAAQSVCAMSGGGVVYFISGGTCIIDASQAGNDNYSDGLAQQSFAVAAGVARTSVIITTAGSGVWIAPPEVTLVTVQAWGGGGGGAYLNTNTGGGGGGGGAYAMKADIPVTPRTSYPYTVGTGGTGTNGASNGTESAFIDSATVSALGGYSAADNSTAGGLGGDGTFGVGDVTHSGGNGANGTTGTGNYGGGGGSSAGTASNGVSATNATGATAPSGGGNGGNGRSSSQGNGSSGSTPGGGGGGALRTSSSNRSGGAGGAGRMVITFITPNYTIAGTATAPAGTGAAAGSLNVSVPYSYDANHNNTFSIDYRPAGTSIWYNWVTDASDVDLASPYTNTITYLRGGTSYEVRVTWSDPDGVYDSALAQGSDPLKYQQTITVSTAAWAAGNTYSWRAPAGVTAATVEAWGSGGGGATKTTTGGGGGGGGGAYSKGIDIPITGGNLYTVVIGVAGSSGVNGGDTYFSDGVTDFVLAKGGNSAATDSAAGATGGLASGGIGTAPYLYSGGNGAAGVSGSYGGGGGSSAGTGANGNNTTSVTGATAPSGGGNGGNGNNTTFLGFLIGGSGSSGSTPGGAGGGGLNALGSATGGAGAAGRVTITFFLYQPTEVTVSGPDSLTYGTPGTYVGAGGDGTGLYAYLVAPVGATTLGCSADPSTGVVTVTDATGTCEITATKLGDATYHARTSSAKQITLVKADQTLSFTSTAPTTAMVGGPSYIPTATATSGLTVALTIDAGAAGVCSINGSGEVSFQGVGACVIDANQVGDNNYNPAPPDQQSFAVATGDQSISWTTTAPTNAAVGGTTYTPAATATSGLTVAITIDSSSASVCSITGGVVSFIGTGTCVIDGNQPGDGVNWNAAPPVTQSFTVREPQTISFTSIAPAAKVGDPNYTPTATATSTLTVALSLDGTSTGCSMDGLGVVSFTSVGTCVIDANQPGDTTYAAADQVQQSFAVDKGVQTITWGTTAPTTAVVAGATYTPTATVNSGLTVALTIDAAATSVCSMDGLGVVSFLSAGTCVIDANQAGNSDWNAAPQDQQIFAVGKGTQTISFTTTAPAHAVIGGATYTPAATASPSGLTVALTVDSSAATICSMDGFGAVSFLTVGTCVIDANQAGDPNWDPAIQVQQSFAVRETQTISFTSSAPAAVVGGPTYTPAATATSALTVAITIDSSASSVCSIDGLGVVSFHGIGACVIDANQAGNSVWDIAEQVQQSFAVGTGSQTISWTTPAPTTAVVGGPTYSPTATATSGLTVAITVDAGAASICSINGAGVVSFQSIGTCVLDANQPGDSNWNAAPQDQQSFAVGMGSQTISWTSTAPTAAAVGGATYTPTATATSGLTVAITIDSSATGVCSIDGGGVVSFLSVGTCVIDANQGGDSNWNAALPEQQTFTVKDPQTITFTSPAPVAKVGGTYTPTATSTSGLTVAISLDGTSTGCTLDTGTGVVSFTSLGTCVIDANQAGNGTYNPAPQVQQSLVIGKGDQVITFTTPAPAAVIGGPTYTPAATGGATGNPVVLTVDATAQSVCAMNGAGEVYFFSAGTCLIDANQAGNTEYNAGTAQQSFAVTGTPKSSVTLTTAGAGTWIAPAGVTSVTVQVWGGGGGGAYLSDTVSSTGGGGGGGGAYSIKFNIPVTEGTSYPYTIGAGGAGTSGQSNGGESFFIDTTTVSALGGYSVPDNTTTGALGGDGTLGVGDLTYSGGNGANGTTGSNRISGGGGSSAGTGSNGTNASGTTGGAAPTGGGKGADGLTSSGNGNTGSLPGGGGSGGRTGSSSGTARSGGAGAVGKIVITYNAPDYTVAGTATVIAGTGAAAGSLNVSMPYTDDANHNNTYTIDYRPAGTSVWYNWVTNASNTASPYATTITYLRGGLSYDVRVTWSDGDGVYGTNPQTITVSTSAWLANLVYSWRAPIGVTAVTFEAWGGGGAGASRTTTGGGGGGGGGAYSKGIDILVIPGNLYTVFIGVAGASGVNGGDTFLSYSGTSLVLAKGGNSVAADSATGATGGQASTGIGTAPYLYSGGNGADGLTGSYGGGGGSSAGSGANGNTATNATGATAPTGGGAGGNGRSGSNGSGTAGTIPGGAGGGGYRTSNGSASGGAGGAGKAVLTYFLYQPDAVSVSGPGSITFGTTGTYVGAGGTGSGAYAYTVAPVGATTLGCSADPSTGVVTVTDASGTCEITATKLGDATYHSRASDPLTITLVKADQSLQFTSTEPTHAAVGGATYTPTAASYFGNPASLPLTPTGQTVILTVDAGSASVCSMDGFGVVSFLTSGTCQIDANQSGDNNFNAASQVYQSFEVKALQTIQFDSLAPTTAVVAGATYTPAATAYIGAPSLPLTPSGLPVTLTVDASASTICTIDGSGVVSFIGAGSCVIDANAAGDATYATADQVQQSFTVGKGDQTIDITSPAPTAKVGGPTYTPVATATSGLAVTFSLDGTSTGCSISAGVVSFTSLGTCVIDADQGGNANWNAAPQKQQSFEVGIGDQSITFTSPAPTTAVVGGPTYAPTATATSGLTVAFTIDLSTAGICSINGSGEVSFLAVGLCKIDANQGGSADYNPAPQVQQSFAVSNGDQTITFDSTEPVGAVAGGPTYQVLAHATSGLTVTFTTDPLLSSVCSIDGSNLVSFHAAGTCKIDANQAGDPNWNAAPMVSQSFTVGIGDQTISFTSSAPSAKVGGPTYTPTATATSGLTVVLSLDGTSTGCAMNGSGVVSFTSIGTCVIDADQAGDGVNWNPALQVQQSFAVALGDQSISWTTTMPSNAVVGGPAYSPAATATSGLTVDITVDPSASGVCSIGGSGAVSFLSAGTCVLDANQGGNGNWNAAAQQQQSFAVRLAQSIYWDTAAPTNAKVGGATYTPGASASPSGLTVTITVDPSAASVCSINGLGVVSFIGAGTCVLNANQAGDSTYGAASAIPQSFTVYPLYRIYLPLILR